MDRRVARLELISRPELIGRALTEPLSMLHERWLHELWDALPADPGTGWALMTTAGSARRDMAVGSDLDVLLIHPRKAQAKD